MIRRTLQRTAGALFVAVALTLALSGCAGGGDGEAAPMPHGNAGVGQGGAQDFGLFRSILEAGAVPGPETIEPVGFFAEHKLDYAPPDCGADVCLHGLFGTGPNLISGSRMGVVQIGLNTPVDPEAIERPPLELVLALDTSGSMYGEPIEQLLEGVRALRDVLEPGDRLSLVTYSDEAEVRFESWGPELRESLDGELRLVSAGGQTNLHDGLATAFRVAEAHQEAGAQTRVLLLSDGVANVGIESRERITALAAAYARRGIGLTTIGVGSEFDVRLMRALGEVGAGSFYFVEDPVALREVFVEEARSFLYPIALDARIDVRVSAGWRIHGVYGTNGWRGGRSEGQVELPMLFVAGRRNAAAPVAEGRRGGGGAILVELAPDGAPPAGAVAVLELSFTDPRSGERRTQTVEVAGPGAEVPGEGWYTSMTVEKGFALLYVYRGLHIAAEQAAMGDLGTARGVLEAIETNVTAWLRSHDDPDIEDDLRWIEAFRTVLEEHDAETPVLAPPEPAYYTCG